MKRFIPVLLVISIILAAALPLAAETLVVGVGTSGVVTGAGDPPCVVEAWQNAAPDREMCLNPYTILPYPSPAPGVQSETEICVWAVITDPNGRGDVTGAYFDVYHPDGSFKVQIHMQKVGPDVWSIALAEAARQLPADRIAELATMLEKNGADLWVGCWTYHSHDQPPGDYTILVKAADRAGNIAAAYQLMCRIYANVMLALDFDGLDFGTLVPGAEQNIMGDDIFAPGTRPTVWNRGNALASIRVVFDTMIGVVEGKTIELFDAQFMGQHEMMPAGESRLFLGPLRPCTPLQIDFSVHPPEFLPSDEYIGRVHLRAELYDDLTD